MVDVVEALSSIGGEITVGGLTTVTSPLSEVPHSVRPPTSVRVSFEALLDLSDSYPGLSKDDSKWQSNGEASLIKVDRRNLPYMPSPQGDEATSLLMGTPPVGSHLNNGGSSTSPSRPDNTLGSSLSLLSGEVAVSSGEVTVLTNLESPVSPPIPSLKNKGDVIFPEVIPADPTADGEVTVSGEVTVKETGIFYLSDQKDKKGESIDSKQTDIFTSDWWRSNSGWRGDSSSDKNSFFNIISENLSTPLSGEVTVREKSQGMQSHEVKWHQVIEWIDNKGMEGEIRVLRVSIDQEELGRLHIRLSLQKGVINGSINASDPVTADLIKINLPHITSVLIKEGLTVGNLAVDIGGRNRDDLITPEQKRIIRDGFKTLESASCQNPFLSNSEGPSGISIFV